MQAVRSSLGRLFSWNLASSEIPNCSKGSWGCMVAVSEAREGRRAPPTPHYTPCLSSS